MLDRVFLSVPGVTNTLLPSLPSVHSISEPHKVPVYQILSLKTPGPSRNPIYPERFASTKFEEIVL